ncbi:hypothetical protein D3C77_588220 [compost metagenome]
MLQWQVLTLAFSRLALSLTAPHKQLPCIIRDMVRAPCREMVEHSLAGVSAAKSAVTAPFSALYLAFLSGYEGMRHAYKRQEHRKNEDINNYRALLKGP